MFDFNSLNVVSEKSEPSLSTQQIQQAVKDIAVGTILMDYEKEVVRTDTHKFCIPVDFDGMIQWVEVSFVAKKDDFDAQEAERQYAVKAEQRRLAERDKAQKRAEKLAKAKPVANGK